MLGIPFHILLTDNIYDILWRYFKYWLMYLLTHLTFCKSVKNVSVKFFNEGIQLPSGPSGSQSHLTLSPSIPIGTLITGLLKYIKCPQRVDIIKVLDTFEEARFWVRLYFSSSSWKVLLVLLGWFLRWEVSSRTCATSLGDAYRICKKEQQGLYLLSSDEAISSMHFVRGCASMQ